ncbi:MAG: hypothetical protein JWN56_2149 [Sphingobacteriales bacterium]|nr:hypothetical protein [Sphingobacteriales bacterium]
MAKCNFSIEFSGSAESLISKAQTAITNNGGAFNGNTESGGFIISSPLGKVSGMYAVEGQNFLISIEDKPFLVSCNKIETTLKQYLHNSAVF